MEYGVIQDVIACLPRGRTLFYYFPDRYAVALLSRYLGEGRTLADVKASRFAKLLQRPALKPVIATKGDGKLTQDDLGACWAVQPECYLLTLGSWGPGNPEPMEQLLSPDLAARSEPCPAAEFFLQPQQVVPRAHQTGPGRSVSDIRASHRAAGISYPCVGAARC